jgi:pyruvate dehydrogenase E2 component (dihydrolipoamide acetyltransferase)
VRAFVGGAATKAHPTKAAASPTTATGQASVPGLSGRAPIALHVPAGTAPREGELETRKPFVGVRRKIAERMQTAKNTAAHFTFVEECDVGRLKDLRNRLRPAAEAAGVKLTFLPFIVRAVVAALKKHPVLNSALDESTNELVTRRYFHIGIAASTDQGLMVPVIKDADRKSILDIAREIDRLGNAAKAGSIASADLAGSTFTITSLGTQGGLFATPILNHPEVGILGVHQIKKKPVVRDDQIVIGEVMLLSLSFDHRIVDGHVGAAFAYDIIGLLESPEALFLDMV